MVYCHCTAVYLRYKGPLNIDCARKIIKSVLFKLKKLLNTCAKPNQDVTKTLEVATLIY